MNQSQNAKGCTECVPAALRRPTAEDIARADDYSDRPTDIAADIQRQVDLRMLAASRQAAQQSDAKQLAIGTDLSPNAEVGTNATGGKSTKLLARFDLLDPQSLRALARKAAELPMKQNLTDLVDATIGNIYWYLGSRKDSDLAFTQMLIHDAVTLSIGIRAVRIQRQGHADQFSALNAGALFRLAEVLGYGASKYTPNNWRAVGVDEHLNHALVHLFAYEGGNKEDDHLGHAFCRIHMALAVHYQGAPWIVGADGVPRPQSQEVAA